MLTTEAAVADLLAAPEPPTAVFATNDGEAFAAIRGLLNAGLRVPEDVSRRYIRSGALRSKPSFGFTPARRPFHTTWSWLRHLSYGSQLLRQHRPKRKARRRKQVQPLRMKLRHPQRPEASNPLCRANAGFHCRWVDRCRIELLDPVGADQNDPRGGDVIEKAGEVYSGFFHELLE